MIPDVDKNSYISVSWMLKENRFITK